MAGALLGATASTLVRSAPKAPGVSGAGLAFGVRAFGKPTGRVELEGPYKGRDPRYQGYSLAKSVYWLEASLAVSLGAGIGGVGGGAFAGVGGSRALATRALVPEGVADSLCDANLKNCREGLRALARSPNPVGFANLHALPDAPEGTAFATRLEMQGSIGLVGGTTGAHASVFLKHRQVHGLHAFKVDGSTIVVAFTPERTPLLQQGEFMHSRAKLAILALRCDLRSSGAQEALAQALDGHFLSMLSPVMLGFSAGRTQEQHCRAQNGWLQFTSATTRSRRVALPL